MLKTLINKAAFWRDMKNLRFVMIVAAFALVPASLWDGEPLGAVLIVTLLFPAAWAIGVLVDWINATRRLYWRSPRVSGVKLGTTANGPEALSTRKNSAKRLGPT